MRAQKVNSKVAVVSKTRQESYMQTLPSSVGLPASALVSNGAGGSRWQVRNTTIPSGLNIDWQANDNGIFYKEISANSAFTFSNQQDGMVINLVVKNTSGGSVTLTFPTFKSTGLDLTVAAGAENVYTFFRANGTIYATEIKGVA